MQTDDKTPDKTTLENVHAEHGSSIQRLTVVLPEDARGYLRWINGMSLGLALSIVLGLSAFLSGYEAWREAQADEYWLSRSEAFLEQLATQGIHVPDDLLRHKE